MPTYDYKCENCGHTFETFQSIKADTLTKCPVCGEEKLKRLIGAGAGLIFKGSGFYLTDYKNKKESSPSSNSKSSDSETKSSDTTAKTKAKKSDSKSSGKTD